MFVFLLKKRLKNEILAASALLHLWCVYVSFSFMKPPCGWWREPAQREPISCWSTTCAAGPTAHTQPVQHHPLFFKCNILWDVTNLSFFFSPSQSLLFSEGECILGERERAHAILLACRHLPMPLLTPPGHRARLLAEAKRTLERVGDRRSLQDCQQILLRLSGGTTIAAS